MDFTERPSLDRHALKSHLNVNRILVISIEHYLVSSLSFGDPRTSTRDLADLPIFSVPCEEVNHRS